MEASEVKIRVEDLPDELQVMEQKLQSTNNNNKYSPVSYLLLIDY